MTFLNKMKAFFESRLFALLTVLLSACFVVFKWEAYGAIILLNIGAVALLFSENIINAFLPALLASTFVIKCYDSASLFLPLWWSALFPIAAIVAYFFIHKRKITKGASFGGILAVSVAVTLGGLFTISPTEYFSGVSLYYVIMLGFGMLGAYLLIRSHVVERDGVDIYERYVDMMLTVGAFATFVVLEYYARNFAETIMVKELADIQWGNNMSTILMITMPFSLYRIRKNMAYLLLFAMNFAALLLSNSRGGWIMGGALFFICLLVGVTVFTKGHPKKRGIALAFALLCIAPCIVAVIWFVHSRGDKGLISFYGEARSNLFIRSFEDFVANPIFGRGLGYTGNSDLYDGKQGTMTWYHMMIPQIVGSLGLVGMYCYGKQIVERFGLMLKKTDSYILTLGLSYVGLLLMSQVNPGEFCPLPYELLAVVNFIMIEKYKEKKEL